jgi:cell division protein ZapA (FtsZ GTPase activity inhibitor)
VGTVLVAIGLEHHVQKAHESFLQNDRKEATSEIRKSLAFLKQEADRADEKAKEALKAAAQELEKLADEVERGTITTVEKLDEAFVHANRALSGHP